MRFLAFALLVITTSYAATIEEVQDTCEPGRSFKKYCNNCNCAADGKVSSSMCTMMYCEPDKWTKDGISTDTDKPVIESMMSETSEIKESCVPGNLFMYYCNICACGENGIVDNAACTRMYCSPDKWYKNGTIKHNPDEFVSKFLLHETRELDNERCVPGTRFMNYCNTCLCNSDGLAAHSACTDIYCNPGDWNKDGSPKIPDNTSVSPSEEGCQPGTQFKNYCNTCFCGSDGRPMCTRMFCNPDDWNKDGSSKHPEKIFNLLRENHQSEEEYCEPGTYFNDYCNTCYCTNPDGIAAYAACTMTYCAPGVWNKDGTLKNSSAVTDNKSLNRVMPDVVEPCEPGKQFMNYCNTCVCGINGLPRCTRMLCDPEEWNKDGSRKHPNGNTVNPLLRNEHENEERCEPGKRFKNYCNTCTCGSNGMPRCTRMNCDPEEWNKDGSRKHPNENTENSLLRDEHDTEERCEPGKQFKNYCNTCECGSNGMPKCTKMYCDPEEWNKDGSRKHPHANAANSFMRYKRDTEQRCQPGKDFKNYCNTCECGSNGMPRCTKMYCDPDEWNKDGSRKYVNYHPTFQFLIGMSRRVQMNCEPGKLFKDECNTCTCANDGSFAICTKMFCESLVSKNNEASQIATENLPLTSIQRSSEFLCQPGRSFNDGCNRCICSKNGKSAACTQMICPSRQAVVAPQVCEPTNLFKIDCNQCSCSKDGLKIACTLMDCPPTSE